MGEDRRGHLSLPLVSRLDRLESMMKYVAGKQNVSRWSSSSHNLVGSVGRQCKPLDLAVREAHLKGSLLDRVASLEDKLFQLCLDIEFCNVPHPTVQKSKGVVVASGHGSKTEQSCPLPTFKNPDSGYKQHGVLTNGFELQGKMPQRVQQRLKQPSTVKHQNGKEDDKNCKTGKKGSPSWPHLRILGC